LVAVEGFRENRRIGCLQGGGCYGRHSGGVEQRKAGIEGKFLALKL